MSESLVKNDDWFSELTVWADINKISNTLIPRDRQQLLELTELSLVGSQLTEIPKSILPFKAVDFVKS